jgi:hypothetical protein
LAGLSALARQSNVLTGRLLAHLVELEERKLHLELGFSSLFAYCVETLGMSEGTAGRRVTAARVCRRFPELFERVARGELHLCALCALAPHLSSENSAELFVTCRGKTRRQVEELLAARFPRPDVREQIRRLPARAPPTAMLSEPNLLSSQASDAYRLPSKPAEIAAVSPNAVPMPALPALPDVPALPAAVRRRGRELEPLSAGRFGVHFTADAELRELIERARALASHQLPNGDLASLVKLMATRFVQQEEKRRFGIGARPRRVKTETRAASSSSLEMPAPPGEVAAAPEAAEPAERETGALTVGNRGRYVPINVRRETHARDRGQCAFVAAEGRRCTARAFLELDHRKPFARFGAADVPNIRLLCRAHNLLHARNCFGEMHVAAKIAARKRHESPPEPG